ncbi:MAG: 2-dehydropantoate 2-reductase [Opitutales bacterium]
MTADLGRIAIVGAGAIGLYYGARLARAGQDVTWLMRSDLKAARSGGIRVETLDEAFTLEPVSVAADPRDIGPVDVVLIGLKATANHALPDLLPPLLKETTEVVTLQNGLGNIEALEGLHPRERLHAGLCFICLNRFAPAGVRNTNRGALTLADAVEDADRPGPFIRELTAVFEAAGVRTRALASLTAALSQKLVWNIPFNGIAIAAGGITTDRICASPALLAWTRALMEEVRQASGALGHPIDPSFCEKQVDRTVPMGPYQPSSLVDWHDGKPVEVEAIWGEPLRRARAAGVPAPHLESLYWLLQYACRPDRQS